MSMVLIYNLDSEKSAKLRMLCRKMNIEVRSVEKEEYGYPLSYLLGLSPDSAAKEIADFDDEMLYIAGLRGGMLNLFLDQLRKRKILIPLKASQTETNMSFSSSELYKELFAEREAIAKGMTFHKE